MLLASLAVVAGLALLVWSADRFVDGAAATARHFGMPPLLIGITIVGMGTSAPEIVVSALAALQGNPGIALGNAYGSNIANIALILGITALINPINVHSSILRKEFPILLAITALSGVLIWDLSISWLDALILLIAFFFFMGWLIWQGLNKKDTSLASETLTPSLSLRQALFWLLAGLILLVISSRLLVWGAVKIAAFFGLSDVIIGLTIVAIGTSLPELASSISAARKGEDDLAVGNIIGSNLFNTLAVVGIAGIIHPLGVPAEVITRDFPVMTALTILLFLFSYGFCRRGGRINRIEGALLLSAYIAYNMWLLNTVLQQTL